MSVFSFSSIQHAFASAFSDLHAALKFVENQFPKVIAKEALVEGITSVITTPLLGPVTTSAVVTIERAAFSALGVLVVAAHATDDAVAAKGVSITLDAVAVAAYKALALEFKQELAAVGLHIG